jgi:hypothetical protein
MSERALALVKSDLADWYTIEWAEHEQRGWLERTGPSSLSYRWSGRVSDADVEGTAAEMLAIAEAIERRGSVSFKRCAARRVENTYALSSPRNSQDPGVISWAQAQQLAATIRTTLDQVSREALKELVDDAQKLGLYEE